MDLSFDHRVMDLSTTTTKRKLSGDERDPEAGFLAVRRGLKRSAMLLLLASTTGKDLFGRRQTVAIARSYSDKIRVFSVSSREDCMQYHILHTRIWCLPVCVRPWVAHVWWHARDSSCLRRGARRSSG